MNFGLIASGGTGTRMGYDIPKQFLKLAGKPILCYSVEKFLNVKSIDYICVSSPKEWIEKTKDLISEYFEKYENKVHVVCGGLTRNETIINMINFVEENLLTDDKVNFAVTHDAARPFITEGMMIKTLERACVGKICTIGQKIYDTVAKIGNGKKIEKYLNREKIVKIQTPQTFNLMEFKTLYNQLTDSEKSDITDCTGVFFAKNKNVEIILSEVDNLKITTKVDYEIACNMTNAIDKKFSY